MDKSKLFILKFGLILLVLVSSNPTSSFAQTSIQNDSVIATSTVISLTNKDRETLGLKALKPNTTLAKAAQMKADDMAKKGYFAHNTPEGLTPWYWFDKAGYNYRYAGENLGVNFTESVGLEKAWMASPTHKANIVNKNYSEIGVGIAYGMYKGQSTIFVVQLFGTEFSKTVAMR